MLKKIALGFTVLLLCLVGGIFYLLNMSQQGFIEHNTQIKWPEHATQIETVTDPSFMKSNWVEAHFKLTPQDMDIFLKQHHFIPYQPTLKEIDQNGEINDAFFEQQIIIRDPQHPLGFLRGHDQFSSQALKFSSQEQFAYLSGNRTGYHAFTILADRKVGSVWIHMNHPD
jgi:hypothetical protein